ncbi:MAG: hypothetical protein CSA68_11825 [Rhodobacterales bacterium]|nr:MAG: hypothetical protein CSA68_11825 [Rhodobacterales bacterium]
MGETLWPFFRFGVAGLFSPENFNRSEGVASYLGLAPVVSQSGGRAARARIRSVGQKRLGGIQVEAVW